PGCPSSRRWCRRWAPSCRRSGRCSRKCGRGAPRCFTWARRRIRGPPVGEPPMTMALRRSWAKDLDAATLYELLKLRVEVFVVEQATPYPELDGRDLLAETRHFWLEGADGEVICTLRLMEEHFGGGNGFRIGRVATLRTARGHGHANR